MLTAETAERGFTAVLEKMGLIRACGADAVDFIHGQLGNDIAGLPPDQACLAGYTAPDGRLIAIFRVWKNGENVWLMLPKALIGPLIKRLKMYVLRAKVQLEDFSDACLVLGFGGAGPFAAVFSTLPEAENGRVESDGATLIRVKPAFGHPRYYCIASREAGPALLSRLFPIAPSAEAETWELAEIEAGEPQVYKATQHLFVPQMLNMDLVGGVSFTKGCYPGQEIVARTQYRGTLKRRMLAAIAASGGEAPAKFAGIERGMDVFDGAEPCGKVVRAARRDAESVAVLLVLHRDHWQSGKLKLGSPDGSAITFTNLPYTFPDGKDGD